MLNITLPLGYDFQSVMADFREKYDRLVYITSGDSCINKGLYKFPEEETYREITTKDKLRVYSSGLVSSHHERVNGLSLYDIKPAISFRLTVPALEIDGKNPPFEKTFTPPFTPSWEKRVVIKVATLEEIPSEWQPYVQRVKSHLFNQEGLPVRVDRYVITAWVSWQAFQLPSEVYPQWNLKDGNLFPPGHTPDTHKLIPVFGVVYTDPFECVVCCGVRGERRMLGTYQSTGRDMQYTRPICLGCCEEAFPQWLALMKGQ